MKKSTVKKLKRTAALFLCASLFVCMTGCGGLVHCIDHRDYSDAVSNADKLLYFSKENGRNRVSVKADN